MCGCEGKKKKKRKKKERKTGRERGIEIDKERGVREAMGGIQNEDDTWDRFYRA